MDDFLSKFSYPSPDAGPGGTCSGDHLVSCDICTNIRSDLGCCTAFLNTGILRPPRPCSPARHRITWKLPSTLSCSDLDHIGEMESHSLSHFYSLFHRSHPRSQYL